MKKLNLRATIGVGVLTFGIMSTNINALESLDDYNYFPIHYDINKSDTINNKIAYITIDDGPSKYTKDIIKILKKHDVHATFFMIDRNMKANKEEVLEIVDSGNSAGFHSVTHDIDKLYKTNDSAKKEFDINKKTFYEITGKTSNIIRLPYGSKPYATETSYENLVDAGYKLWDWSIDTQDWKKSSSEIVDSVKQQVNGQEEVIILLHEKKQTVEALDDILEYLNNEGYDILPIKENQVPINFWTIDINK